MRVAVLGAGGTIAPAIVRDLAESEEVEELLLLDLDRERAQRVAAEHGAGKARAARGDARVPGDLQDALDGCQVLVNSASYRINLEAMAACLAAHCHYLDLGGLYWMTGRQLAMATEFRKADLLAVLGIGSAPGKTNLMAAKAMSVLCEGHAKPRLETVHVSAAGRDLDPPAGESFPYALQTLLDEVTMAPIAIARDEPVELEPLAPGGEVDFGHPIGRATALHTIHSEMFTFPPSFGCREASFRLSLSPAVEERLRELASARPEEVARVAAAAAPPSAQTVSVHVVDATVNGSAVRVRSVTSPHREWGLGGGIVSTATPIAACARLLARGLITARGVLPPESCIDPDLMFAELQQRGVHFELTQTTAPTEESPA